MPTTAARLKWIPRAIRCFLEQTYKNSELLILEDGAEAVRESIPSHPRIRYVAASKCRALGDKRNVACDCADGDVIAHWDDDDWSAPGRLAEQVDALVESGLAVCGYIGLMFWDEAKQEARRYKGRQQYAAGTTLVYRKSWQQAHRFSSMRVGEDFHFISPAVRQNQLLVLPDSNKMVATSHDRNSCPRDERAVKSWTLIDRSEIPEDYFRL